MYWKKDDISLGTDLFEFCYINNVLSFMNILKIFLNEKKHGSNDFCIINIGPQLNIEVPWSALGYLCSKSCTKQIMDALESELKQDNEHLKGSCLQINLTIFDTIEDWNKETFDFCTEIIELLNHRAHGETDLRGVQEVDYRCGIFNWSIREAKEVMQWWL